MAWRSDSLHEKISQVQWGNNIFQKEETDNRVTKKKKIGQEWGQFAYICNW